MTDSSNNMIIFCQDYEKNPVVDYLVNAAEVPRVLRNFGLHNIFRCVRRKNAGVIVINFS